MKKSYLVAALALIIVLPACADESITLHETQRVPANSTLHFDIPVGEVFLETHDGEDVQLKVTVSNKDGDWFGDDDVSDSEMQIEVDGDDIYFSVNKKENLQKWQIVLPESANIDLDVGVGSIDIEGVEKTLNVDLGVGEINAELANNDYRRIDLDSGVGEVLVKGLKDAEVETSIVSESVNWRGDGEYKLEIEVGVGGIDVEF